MEHVNVKLNLTEAQFKKLLKGTMQTIANHQIGHGISVRINKANAKKTLNALKKNTGFRLKMDEHELKGSGFNNIKKMSRNTIVTPEVDRALGSIGIKTSKQPILQTGQGIFGSKFDRALKRAGIKGAAYKIGDALKPFVHKAIDAGTVAASAYGIPIAPVSYLAHQYIDHPDEGQAIVRNMVGGGISKPKLLVRDDGRNIIDSNNGNFYPIQMPTFKQRQHGGSFRGGSFKI